MKMSSVYVRIGAGIAMVAFALGANAQFVPPAGFSGGKPLPGVAVPSDPAAPPVARIADDTLANLFHVDPTYRGGTAGGHVKVVGAFALTEAKGAPVTGAYSPGFLPVTLQLGDGRCFTFSADYTNGTLANGRLNKTGCEGQPRHEGPASAPPPQDRALRFIGTAWSYDAWADDRNGTTIVTAPYTKTYQPLFTARMKTIAIMAMNGPDWPGGNVTLVGRIKGRLTIVTLEVGY
jgi:hypothetical protein